MDKRALSTIWGSGASFGCPAISVDVPIGAVQWALLPQHIKEHIISISVKAADEAIFKRLKRLHNCKVAKLL